MFSETREIKEFLASYNSKDYKDTEVLHEDHRFIYISTYDKAVGRHRLFVGRYDKGMRNGILEYPDYLIDVALTVLLDQQKTMSLDAISKIETVLKSVRGEDVDNVEALEEKSSGLAEFRIQKLTDGMKLWTIGGGQIGYELASVKVVYKDDVCYLHCGVSGDQLTASQQIGVIELYKERSLALARIDELLSTNEESETDMLVVKESDDYRDTITFILSGERMTEYPFEKERIVEYEVGKNDCTIREGCDQFYDATLSLENAIELQMQLMRLITRRNKD